LRTYTARLLGAEDSLVLHGGGNTSVKSTLTNILGEAVPTIFVKASGYDMARIEPGYFPALDLEALKKLRGLPELYDQAMLDEFRVRMLRAQTLAPSIETLAHAFIPWKFVDHTHADAILALANQPDGERRIEDALGSSVVIVGYVTSGFKLAKASAAAYDANPGCSGMVWMRHGLVTWGETAQQAYERTIELASRAEGYLAAHAKHPLHIQVPTPITVAENRWSKVAPILRGLLAQPSGDPDSSYRRVILRPLITREVLDFVDSEEGEALARTPPLTADHLIQTRAFPLWVRLPGYDDTSTLGERLREAVKTYASEYRAYVQRNVERMPAGVRPFDALPSVVLMPGLGAVCAGADAAAAEAARDITEHTLTVKAQVAATGSYQGLSEPDLFDMEYHLLQHAKLNRTPAAALSGEVAVVTGAAGAIGSAVADALLREGCHVAVTDLAGEPLERLTSELMAVYGERVLGVTLDVTDPDSVAAGFGKVIQTWGGVDLVIVNAGAAIASSLTEMTLDSFRRLERINVEGALLVLAEAGRHFKLQGTSGDVVLISTKNVFSPGARFGAYSATKAAAHQLARIASLELAEIGVRVNMVAPDAVFSHGDRKSGLWVAVGPDRMRARGLSENEMEAYYRARNLLKTRVTAQHVANAVLFFATRQTPTTGATLPVDGGLPDATPR
ncbi:MAG TPA: bifunctional aldolase/short-chain dehydrogenase, partial [Terriglobia bacterium]|nr:bifunctional aldolase/short-chain dehydrogenase [Terriglobia bacterium]